MAKFSNLKVILNDKNYYKIAIKIFKNILIKILKINFFENLLK